MTNLVGQDVGRYHIIEQLGQGGMATVYRAYDTRLEREVALKFIRREEIGPAYLDQLFKRFEREAKSLAQLSHPNIVKVYDYGEFEGVPYLVMEYLPGGTLKQRMGQPIPAADAARLLLPVARALAYAHRENLIHRDVKPANILITRSGEPMLTDFGIAKILSGEGSVTLTGTGVGLGTPDYMAPEQWTNQVVPQTDIYALGIVFYEMVTGHRPFTADTPAAVLLKQMQDALPRPRSFVTNLPDEAEQLLYKALAKDPKDRYATMDLMAAALDHLVRSTEAKADTQPELKPPAPDATRVAAKAPEPVPAAPPRPASPPPAAPRPIVAPAVEPSPAASTVVDAEATVLVPAAPAAPTIQPVKVPVWIWVTVGLVVVAIVVLGVGGALVLPGLLPKGQPTATAVPTSAPVATQPAASPIPAELGVGSTRVADKDGMPQVYVPASPFTMGSNTGANDEQPQRTVYLDAYWMDQTDVTNAMFVKFISASGYQTDAQTEGTGFVHVNDQWVSIKGANWLHPQGPDSDVKNRGSHPVVQVSYNDARAYCQWAGRHLPTEAQWEKAARGRDGRMYPWGNDMPVHSLLNFRDEIGSTTQVGLYPSGASPYGALDMAGNVWNWVLDWYGATYYADAPVRNPVGPLTGQQRLTRGGSWFDTAKEVRTTARYPLDPMSHGSNVGFRCASVP